LDIFQPRPKNFLFDFIYVSSINEGAVGKSAVDELVDSLEVLLSVLSEVNFSSNLVE
jgi:hypothetical protein